MKYIFLDVDGVLNNARTTAVSPEGWAGISSGLVKRLSEIAEEAHARIILTSTWKQSYTEDYMYLLKKLRQHRLDVAGKIKEPNDDVLLRGKGIKAFLSEHDCESYVILDDEVFDYKEENILDHAVITDPKEGLTKNDVEKAIGILNGQLR